VKRRLRIIAFSVILAALGLGCGEDQAKKNINSNKDKPIKADDFKAE
jgi:hypothetical protein